MKKYNVLLFVLVLSTLCLQAQYAPIGSKWYYGIKDFKGTENFYTYEIDKDTIMLGDTYSKIFSKYNTESFTYYLLKDNSRTYYWNGIRKCLLFDTNVKKGDSLIIDAYFYLYSKKKDTTVTLQIKIDSIIHTQRNQLNKFDTLKTFLIKNISNKIISGYLNYGYFTDNVIKLTSTNNWLISSFDNITTGDDNIYLRCVNSINYNYKDSTLASKPCNYNNVGIKDLLNKNSIAIYPNPAKNKLNISFGYHVNSININIYNYAGQLINQSNIKNNKHIQIDISDLGVGLYFIEFIDEETKYTSKFIKE